MSSHYDVSTLNWVKGEIDDTLEQARSALERYVEDPDDQDQLAFCSSYLHQVTGTLKMVELRGAAGFAVEMERLSDYLTGRSPEQEAQRFELLMRTLLMLPAYLESLQEGGPDSLLILLPTINELRQARGESALSEKALFQPDLSIDAPPGPSRNVAPGPLATELRRYFRAALANLARGQQRAASLKAIATVFEKLLAGVSDPAVRRWAWISAAYAEALRDEGLVLDATAVQLLAKNEKVLSHLAEGKGGSLRGASIEPLLRALLYQVAHAENRGGRVQEVYGAFALDALLPGPEVIERVREYMGGFNAELKQTVSRDVLEELQSAKERLDLLGRMQSRDPAELPSIAGQLTRVAEVLGVVHEDKLVAILTPEIARMQEMISAGSAPDDQALMNIAGAILAVESALTDWGRVYTRAGADDNAADQDERTPQAEAEQDRVVRQVMAEALQQLIFARDAVNDYVAQADPAKAQTAIDGLKGIAGGLVMVAYSRPARIIQATALWVREHLLGEAGATQDQLDLFADAIMSVEYYLEAFMQHRVHPGSVLDVAERAVAELGYPVDQVEQLEQAVRETVQVSPSEPAADKTDSPLPEVGDEHTTDPTLEREAAIEAGEGIVQAGAPEAEPVGSAASSSEPAAAASASASNSARGDSLLPDDLDDEILEIFVEEAEEELATIGEMLPLWRARSSDEESLTRLRRAFHTLKGSGRLVGATALGDFAWAFEHLLNQHINGAIDASDSMFMLLDQSVSGLNQLLAHLKGGSAPTIDLQALIEAAEEMSRGGAPTIPQATAVPIATPDTVAEQEVEAEPVIEPVLCDIYSAEAQGHLQALEAFITACRGHRCQCDDALIRALHTLQGSSRAARLEGVAVLAGALEAVARHFADRGVPFPSADLWVLEETVAFIRAVLDNLAAHGRGLPADEKLLGAARAIDVSHSRAFERSADTAPAAVDAAPGLDETDFISTPPGSADPAPDLPLIAEETAFEEDVEPAAEIAGGTPGDATESVAGELETLLESEWGAGDTEAGEATAAFPPATAEPESAAGAAVELADESAEWVPGEPMDAEAGAEVSRESTDFEPGDPFDAELDSELSSTSSGFTAAETSATESATGLPDDSSELLLDEAFDASAPTESGEFTLVDGFGADHGTDLSGTSDELTLGEAFDAETATELPGEVAEPTLAEALALTADPDTADEFEVPELEEMHDLQVEPVAEEAAAELSFEEPLSGETEAALSDEFAEFSLGDVFDDAPAERAAPGPSDIADIGTTASGTTVAPASDYDSELAAIFLEEATELLNSSDELIQAWPGDRENRELVEGLQRDLHTLKGGARMADVPPIGDLSHHLETLLTAVADGKIAVSDSMLKLLQLAHDRLAAMVECLRNHQPLPTAGDLITSIDALLGVEVAEPDEEQSASRAPPQTLAASPSIDVEREQDSDGSDRRRRGRIQTDMVKVRSELLDELINLAGESSIFRARIEQEISGFRSNLEELDQTVARLREQLRAFEIETEAQMQSTLGEAVGQEYAPDNEDFDPLEFDRFTNMQQLSRSMAESLNDLTNLGEMLQNVTRESETLLLQQSRFNTELQEGLMRTRMVPLVENAPRLRRIVRQTAAELGRDVELRFRGVEVEMDRYVVERILAPIEHMLRNAIAHSIEPPEVRGRAGKPAFGTIAVEQVREGNEVVVRIIDDGAGINIEAVRKKAVERGLMHPEAELTDKEIMSFILESGFSTAQALTQISGRGVGMDVVAREVRELNGTLEVDSEPGQGTTVTMRLPVTLSISRALLVALGEDHYAVPLQSIVGVVRLSQKELDTLKQREEPVYQWLGEEYRLLELADALGVPPDELEVTDKPSLLMAHSGSHRTALVVHRLLGSREVVVKSVGKQLSALRALSGATILADGQVALILDMPVLVRGEFARSGPSAGIAERRDQAPEKPLVMVVDDSITVRKVTQRLLERNGMAVVTARDGVDALALLEEVQPAVMLLDIEMPRMDGYELATHIRNDPALGSLPLIMITSRSGEKHRQKAMDIGVNIYMSKPFQESTLLENIHTLVSHTEATA